MHFQSRCCATNRLIAKSCSKGQSAMASRRWSPGFMSRPLTCRTAPEHKPKWSPQRSQRSLSAKHRGRGPRRARWLLMTHSPVLILRFSRGSVPSAGRRRLRFDIDLRVSLKTDVWEHVCAAVSGVSCALVLFVKALPN